MSLSNKDHYRCWTDSYRDVPIFHQPWWLDTVCGEENWDCAIAMNRAGKIEAVWPYLVKRKYGITMLIQPHLTPRLGILFNKELIPENRERIYTFEQKVTEKLLYQMPKVNIISQRFRGSYSCWLPLYWNGFKQSTKYSYVIRGLNDMNQVRGNYKSSVRNDIRKAQTHYTTEVDIDVNKLFNLCTLTYSRRKTKNPFGIKLLDRLVGQCVDRGVIEMNFAVDKHEHPASCSMTVYDKKNGYNIIQGSDKENQLHGAVQMLLDYALERASERVDIFDFEGSMIPEIERVYRAFNGELDPYYEISKFSNHAIELGYRLRNK